jgi:hypothetical protein
MFSPKIMEILRCSRLVILQKPDGGVRPIAIGNAWIKLAGSIAMAMSATKPAPFQHAVGQPDGAKKIVHIIREHAKQNRTIVRFDMKNGFGAMPRAWIAEKLSQRNDVEHLTAYFRMMYSSTVPLVAFERGQKPKFLQAADGILQGDAASAFLLDTTPSWKKLNRNASNKTSTFWTSSLSWTT